MTREISLQESSRLINHGPVILVTVTDGTKPNIITLAWNMPLSHKPPLVAVSIGQNRYSHDLLKKSGEFVINVPDVDILGETIYCGTTSGRKVDKFKETGLTAIPARRVKSPLIKQCLGHLECRVVNTISAGDHTVFVGEVLIASVKENIFDGTWKVEKAKTIHHLGGTKFTTPDKTIDVSTV
jgi:flavin reductase (DIM6/NTAB) family NADH-FMN oxidoreductase RutF